MEPVGVGLPGEHLQGILQPVSRFDHVRAIEALAVAAPAALAATERPDQLDQATLETVVIPRRDGLGPAHAIAKVHRSTGLAPADADLVEINEAFAAQLLAVLGALRSREFGDSLGHDGPLGEVPRFQGTHPAVMEGAIQSFDWQDELYEVAPPGKAEPMHRHQKPKYRFLTWLENTFFGGRHMFSSRNYELLPGQSSRWSPPPAGA